jgi:hypothetical protein
MNADEWPGLRVWRRAVKKRPKSPKKRVKESFLGAFFGVVLESWLVFSTSCWVRLAKNTFFGRAAFGLGEAWVRFDYGGCEVGAVARIFAVA